MRGVKTNFKNLKHTNAMHKHHQSKHLASRVLLSSLRLVSTVRRRSTIHCSHGTKVSLKILAKYLVVTTKVPDRHLKPRQRELVRRQKVRHIVNGKVCDREFWVLPNKCQCWNRQKSRSRNLLVNKRFQTRNYKMTWTSFNKERKSQSRLLR